MKQFLYTFYKSSFRSVPEVIEHMEELQEKLSGTDLTNLRAFNKTYLIITQNVYRKIGTGYFAFDDSMTAVDINFACYYFRALKTYISGGKPPPAWKILFDQCKRNSHYQFIYMALGVNAHVNNDLAQSLLDVVKNEAYKVDFDTVNTIIHESISEVIRTLQEQSRMIATSEKMFLPVYTVFLDAVIQNWREYTWQTYTALKNQKTTVPSVEHKAEQIAILLCKVKSIFAIHHLRKVLL